MRAKLEGDVRLRHAVLRAVPTRSKKDPTSLDLVDSGRFKCCDDVVFASTFLELADYAAAGIPANSDCMVDRDHRHGGAAAPLTPAQVAAGKSESHFMVFPPSDDHYGQLDGEQQGLRAFYRYRGQATSGLMSAFDFRWAFHSTQSAQAYYQTGLLGRRTEENAAGIQCKRLPGVEVDGASQSLCLAGENMSAYKGAFCVVNLLWRKGRFCGKNYVGCLVFDGDRSEYGKLRSTLPAELLRAGRQLAALCV